MKRGETVPKSKQLPPASSEAPWIVLPCVHETFDFRVLRQNRRVVQEQGREAELENFHQVLSDISMGIASNEASGRFKKTPRPSGARWCGRAPGNENPQRLPLLFVSTWCSRFLRGSTILYRGLHKGGEDRKRRERRVRREHGGDDQEKVIQGSMERPRGYHGCVAPAALFWGARILPRYRDRWNRIIVRRISRKHNHTIKTVDGTLPAFLRPSGHARFSCDH